MGGADMGNGTFVGLDVHARSVVAGLIDERTGEVRTTRAPHATDELVGWLGILAIAGAHDLRGRADRLWPGPGTRGCGHRVPGGGAEHDPARERGPGQERPPRPRAPGT